MNSKVKSKTEIQGPTCEDLDVYYSCKINSDHPGCTLTYKIRNFTNYPIRVRSRFGYCQIIHPTDKTTGTVADHRLERESVWLDVEFSTKNPVESCSINIEKSNPIDKAIHACLNGYLYHAVEEQRSSHYHRSFTCSFGICLSEITPNMGNDSYFSEMLGVIIDINNNRLTKTFLDDSFNKGIVENHTPLDVDLGKSNFEIITFIDNAKDYNSLWTMRNGKPSKIKSIVDNNRTSGIYIYSGERFTNNIPYIFIPICDINDDKLREYGLSYTEKELVEGVRTKEYVETVKTYEQQLVELKKAHEKEIAELKKSHEKELTETKRTCEKDITETKRTCEKEVTETKRTCEKEVAELKRVQERELTETKRSCERTITESKRDCERTITENKRSCEREIDQREKALNKELAEKEKAFNNQLDDADEVIKEIQVSLKEREKANEKLTSELNKATQKISRLELDLVNANLTDAKNKTTLEKKEFNNIKKIIEAVNIVIMGYKLIAKNS